MSPRHLHVVISMCEWPLCRRWAVFVRQCAVLGGAALVLPAPAEEPEHSIVRRLDMLLHELIDVVVFVGIG